MIEPTNECHPRPPLNELGPCIYCGAEATENDDGYASYINKKWRWYHTHTCREYPDPKEKKNTKRQPWWLKK